MDLLTTPLSYPGWQHKMRGDLSNTDPFIGKIKEDDHCPEDTRIPNDMHIQCISHAAHGEDPHSAQQAFITDFSRELLVYNRTYDTGNINLTPQIRKS